MRGRGLGLCWCPCVCGDMQLACLRVCAVSVWLLTGGSTQQRISLCAALLLRLVSGLGHVRWGVANLSNARPVCACCANCVAALFGGVLFMFTPALMYSCSDIGFGSGDGLLALALWHSVLFSCHATHMRECGHSRACQLYSTSIQLPSPEPSVYSLFRPLHFRQQCH